MATVGGKVPQPCMYLTLKPVGTLIAHNFGGLIFWDDCEILGGTLFVVAMLRHFCVKRTNVCPFGGKKSFTIATGMKHEPRCRVRLYLERST